MTSQALVPATSLATSAMSPGDLSASFATFGVLLERESDEVESVSKLVRDLHRINRAVASSLQSIHTTGCTSDAALSAVAAAAQVELMASTPVYQSMSAIIRASSSPAYKLHHTWQFALQQSIFLLCLCHYLQHRSLPPLSAVSTLLQLDLVTCDLDDYLTGVTYISKELTRLAVNAVRSGNPSLVSPISVLLHDLYAAYRLLNMRNGDLRRKVDGLKSGHSRPHLLTSSPLLFVTAQLTHCACHVSRLVDTTYSNWRRYCMIWRSDRAKEREVGEVEVEGRRPTLHLSSIPQPPPATEPQPSPSRRA